ncbi:MAG: hypothetical protein RIC95_05660 [Vicingaceae bacterium]
MEFPQFRRYKNQRSYFEIRSNEHFIEYKVEGKKLAKYEIHAKILPERNLIQDMLYQAEPYWENIDRETLESFLDSY